MPAYRGVTRFDQIWRYFVGLAIGPAVLITGIVMKVGHSASCGDVQMSPGEVCRDNDSGTAKTYDEVASGSQGVSTFLIVVGVIITLIAVAWFAYRWQNRAERPLLPPKEPKRVKVRWTWVEARLAENAQHGLAVRVSPTRYPHYLAARQELMRHLRAQGQSDPVYARGAAAMASATTPLPIIVAPPLAWFLVDLPVNEDAKERIRAALADVGPDLRESLRSGPGAANTGSAEVG